MLNRTLLAVSASVAVACVSIAGADVVFQTADPFGGFFGLIGFDVSASQSVAARFTPTTEYTLDKVQIWFMSNDFEGTIPQTVTVTLRTDTNPGGEYDSVPSSEILESWTLDLNVVGWNPILQDFTSLLRPALHAGTRYWVVAESSVMPGQSPVWCWSSFGNEFTATTQSGAWQSGSGAAVAINVLGNLNCRSDFNHDGITDFFDYLDFVNEFASNGRFADFNFDGVIDFFDYLDFVAAFNNGC